jgi:arabinofuranan 3-O-arabinosyltransferase
MVGCTSATLRDGESTIRTGPGSTTGIDVDQLVFRSDRGVEPAPASLPVVSRRHSDVHLSADIPAADHDRWLVLAQSDNDGWKATLDGRALDRTVVDGFANGWLVPAGAAATVELTWTPQRWVDRALVCSALFAMIALVLAWRGRRRERDLTARPGGEPSRPVLGPLPLARRPGPLAGPRVSVAVGLMVTVVAALNLPQWPLLAPVLGVVAALAAASPRFDGLLAFGAAGALGSTALYVMAEQTRRRHPPDFVWPQQFDEVHILGVVTILLLAGEYLRTAARLRVSGSDSERSRGRAHVGPTRAGRSWSWSGRGRRWR